MAFEHVHDMQYRLYLMHMPSWSLCAARVTWSAFRDQEGEEHFKLVLQGDAFWVALCTADIVQCIHSSTVSLLFLRLDPAYLPAGLEGASA